MSVTNNPRGIRARRASDEGSAMILSLIIVMALSVVGGALTVLALSETYGSMNYRLMSQARYGAESAVHKAANYLLNNYALPGGGGDPLVAYDMTNSPVASGGSPVVLSAMTGVASNYPAAATQTAFRTAAAGSLVVGDANVQYAASATLLSMREVEVYGSVTPIVIQTWQLTGSGTTTGARSAHVEVTATLERQTVPLFNYAVFATAPGCGALTFSGGSVVDSYDSENIVVQGGNVVTNQYGGNIGSNGNLNESGNPTTIYGTMSTPRTGVGNCSANGVDAWSISGNAQVTGGLIQLPQAITYPTPAAPNPMPPTNTLGLTTSTTCGSIVGCTAGSPSGLQFAPGEYGNINMSGQAVLHLVAGEYAVNSISLSGNSTLVIDSGPVIMNLGGTSVSTVADFSGGAVINSALDPSLFQIEYAGTSAIRLSGGASSAGMVYAPNAPASLSGGTHWFGAIVARTVNASGGMHVHNDRQLANEFLSVGNYMLSSFSWKKF